ncbi:TRAP transporter small permease [Thermodesulfobacteriota bacterium]
MTEEQHPPFLNRTSRFLLRLEDGLLVLLFLLMLAMAVTQIVLRNFFGIGIVWGDVMVRILVLWIGLVGAMVASRKGNHISIDLVARYLPKRMKGLADGLCAFFTSLVCAVMVYFSLQLVLREFEEGGTAFAKIPFWICEAIIPLAFTIIALRYLILAFNNFTTTLKSMP